MFTRMLPKDVDLAGFTGQDVHEYLTELNISRGWMVALAVLLFQFANLFDPAFYIRRGLWIGFGIQVSACMLFLIYFGIHRREDGRGSWRGKWIYLCFWVLITLGMMPYFAVDVAARGMPTNCILLCCALMIVPVFPMKETVLLFGVYTAANLIISVGMGAAAFYNLYVIAVCAVGCLFSCETHQFYINVIDKLSEQSRTDHMTGLLNRRGGRERVETLMQLCLRHGRPFAFFMVDIDCFKAYNDNYGHQHGDEALISAARCLEECFCRESDVICRYGGEEFLIAASIAKGDTAERIAERARRKVEDKRIPAPCCSESPWLTVSVGASYYEPPDTRKQNISVEAMVKKADEALYTAKTAGRNCVSLLRVNGEDGESEARTG